MDENLRNGLERFRLDLIHEILSLDNTFINDLDEVKALRPDQPTADDVAYFAQLGGVRVGYANVLSALFGINIYDRAHPLWESEE